MQPDNLKKILLVEDDFSSAQLIPQWLEKEGYDISAVSKVPAALSAIKGGGDYDYILTDLIMPNHKLNGIDLIRELQAKRCPIPVVAMSNVASSDISALAVKLGAVDFINKNELVTPKNKSSLRKTLVRIETEVEKAKAARQEKEELVRQATRDDLTNLYTLREFMLHLNEEIARHKRRICKVLKEEGEGQRISDPYVFSLLFIDINHFKEVNDSFGHLYADKTLQTLAEVISKKAGRKHLDLACRYGGDEIALLLPDTNKKGAEHVTKKIIEFYDQKRQEVAYQKYLELAGSSEESLEILVGSQAKEPVEFPLEVEMFERYKREYGTLSVGIMESPPQEITPEQMIVKADLAMYQAKLLAKKNKPPTSTFMHYQPGMQRPKNGKN